jgi:hypothetical protein
MSYRTLLRVVVPAITPLVGKPRSIYLRRGFSMQASWLRCAECGGQRHSVKPWRLEDLLGKPQSRRRARDCLKVPMSKKSHRNFTLLILLLAGQMLSILV